MICDLSAFTRMAWPNCGRIWPFFSGCWLSVFLQSMSCSLFVVCVLKSPPNPYDLSINQSTFLALAMPPFKGFSLLTGMFSISKRGNHSEKVES